MEDKAQVLDEILPLRDVVFKTLRKEILTGALKPGERLMEIHLAQRLGVSRTPIREAIRKLELEGLVVMLPRRGAHVADITAQNLRDVLEVRRVLECLAIELTCDRITDEEKEILKERMQDFERAVKTRDASKTASADVAYHDWILQCSKNARLIQLVNHLGEQMYRYRFEYLKDEEKYEQIIEEHRTMYDSIMERTKALAATSVRTHIDNQEIAIMKKIHKEQKQ